MSINHISFFITDDKVSTLCRHQDPVVIYFYTSIYNSINSITKGLFRSAKVILLL